ncbi:hypothetical protein PILCRDRAFT_8828 [Piloderma croceum F 1598]|uniref:Uncharacterized protein n=1 Tax=Piloderma croceum (strain F 1598) TaxID=765440 RepID=A0A0C3FNX5_PILCF|nr:hypothetical protein PILCRDRAFT_8828 [Piloderma croceum F 1598]
MLSQEGKMEKSFLNFKAVNPYWNPTDPSGYLYLSRMGDFSATGSPQLRRRMLGHENTLTGTILRLRERKQRIGRSSTEVESTHLLLLEKISSWRCRQHRSWQWTAVRGDSHDGDGLSLPPSNDNKEVGGGVGSELGDLMMEDDGMKDGGVLGLLAQIYGTKGQGPARVI